MPDPATRRLVLVGAGHAHLHVLREWAGHPMPGVAITLVSPAPTELYSGMVPGYLQGQYALDELEIDVAMLARCAGARHVVDHALRISAGERIVSTATESIEFDLCSVDVGSGVGGGTVPGVHEHALVLRPMSHAIALRARIDTLVARAGTAPAACVVGGGAGGLEVAFALERAFHASRTDGTVMLVDGSRELLAGETTTLRTRVSRLVRTRGIGLALGSAVRAVRADGVLLANGASIDADLVVWVTGTAPQPLLLATDLPRDSQGYLMVDDTLRTTSGAPGWAAGDCATLQSWPDAPRSGATAVRQGPILLRNLRAALGAGSSRRYRPRRRTLALLNTADDRALARYGAWHRHGRILWWLKQRIDRRWIRRFVQHCDPVPPAGG